MKKILKKKGFTLIELIVVITILGILVAIAVPSILNYVTEAQNATARANYRTLETEVALFMATGDNAPADPYVFTVGSQSYSCDWSQVDGTIDCTPDIP